jgi:hypothetical protein
VGKHLKAGEIQKAFTVLQYPQFYLQTAVYSERFATQLKLDDIVSSKYEIGASFEEKVGLNGFVYEK